MNDKPMIEESLRVSCQVCLKVVPKSVAESLEGSEYVYYFCGADCYEQWQQQPEADHRSKPAKG